MAEMLFADVERRFEAELGASRLSRRFREWRSEHVPLEHFKSIDDLLGFFRDRSIPYAPKDEIAGILCALIPNDELAKLLLVKLYLPGLMAKRRALFGRGLTQEELDFALLDGFLDRAAKTLLGTEKLSGRLLAAARGRVEREIQKTAKHPKPDVPAAVDEVLTHAKDPTDIAEEAVNKAAAVGLLKRALNEGVIGEDQAKALWAADVRDLPGQRDSGDDRHQRGGREGSPPPGTEEAGTVASREPLGRR